MKKLTIYFLVFLLTATNIFGQPAIAENIHLILMPNEKLKPMEIETSCFILLQDYHFQISIPLGKSFEVILPKGTKFIVEKGIYSTENPTNGILEFELVSVDKCK